MKKMRAKLVLNHIANSETCERLSFNAVAASTYPSDGSDEDNTYAKWSPSVELGISITNPALIGQFQVGEKYYVDFTPTDKAMSIQLIDAELPETSKVAPRVTQDQIDQLHCSLRVLTHHFPGTTSTIAVAALPDGFVAGVGHSACVSVENFDPAVGEQIAKRNALNAAREKLWELEGYALRNRMQENAILLRRPNPAHGAPKPAGHNPVA